MINETLSTLGGALALMQVSGESAIGTDDLDVLLEGKTEVTVTQKGAAQPKPQEYRGGDRDRRYDRDRDYDRGRDRYGRERTITCSSRGGFERCSTGGRIDSLRYVEGRYGDRCRLGRDWGVERSAVWVDNGCRAQFVVSTGYGRDNPRRDDRYSDIGRIYCASEDYRYHVCRIRESFTNLRIEDRRSDARCTRDRDWGVTREGVWVRNGCRAVFSYEIRGRDRYSDRRY